MTIGENIRKARLEKGMTQKQVADACGMADSAIRKYESGQVTPKYNNLQRIADALGVKASTLLPSHYSSSRQFFIEERITLSEMLEDLKERKASQDLLQEIENRCKELDAILDKDRDEIDADSAILTQFHKLNEDGQQKAVERVEELTEILKYQRTTAPELPPPAREGTDTTPDKKPPTGP